MYLYTSQELQLIHEERVNNLIQKNQISSRKAKYSGNTPIKQIMKLFKREEA